MKKIFIFTGLMLCAMMLAPAVFAELRAQSINGSTGLFSIPSGRIGWENTGKLSFDFAYRAVINNHDGTAHIPSFGISLFNWVELSGAFDIQPEFKDTGDKENTDILTGIKIRLPNTANTAIAVGADIQIMNLANDSYSYAAYQPYVAITYLGEFFNMPAETTVVFGKTFYSGGPKIDSNIDFGMGFDLVLFPDVFGNTVHWIIDFANFSYSDNAWPHNLTVHTEVWWRGVLNTGFRIDLSTIPVLSKFKFAVDLIFNDLFDDENRSFTVGAVFGFSAL